LFQHIQHPGHGLSTSFEDGLLINFPHSLTQAIIGSDDIYLDAQPMYEGFSTQNIKETHITVETKTLDNLISSLFRYYKEVKTKHQFGFDILASF
jgi:hypothetical protein